MEQILTELQTVFSEIPDAVYQRAADKINRHPRVFLYGAGRSGLMLRALAMRLAQMGRTVYYVGETITPALAEGDLLILASASGTTRSVCEYAQSAKKLGADLLILTASTDSVLTQISPADVFFRTSTKDSSTNSRQVMGSLFEQSLLLFGDRLVLELRHDAADMRKLHANLE